MRVQVDDARCQGHTLCTMHAPDIFKSRPEDGHSYVEIAMVPAELEQDVRRAAGGCPEGAIRIQGDPDEG